MEARWESFFFVSFFPSLLIKQVWDFLNSSINPLSLAIQEIYKLFPLLWNCNWNRKGNIRWFGLRILLNVLRLKRPRINFAKTFISGFQNIYLRELIVSGHSKQHRSHQSELASKRVISNQLIWTVKHEVVLGEVIAANQFREATSKSQQVGFESFASDIIIARWLTKVRETKQRSTHKSHWSPLFWFNSSSMTLRSPPRNNLFRCWLAKSSHHRRST